MTHSVTVARSDLLKGLKSMKLLGRLKESAEALIYMESDELVIALPGASICFLAQGTWSGEVRVPAAFVIGFTRVPPMDDPVQVQMRRGRLYVGTYSVECTEQDSQGSAIDLPIDPNLQTLLRLRFQYPEDRIERAGLSKRLGESEAKAKNLIMRAAKTLSPLGISEADLFKVLHEGLQKGIETR